MWSAHDTSGIMKTTEIYYNGSWSSLPPMPLQFGSTLSCAVAFNDSHVVTMGGYAGWQLRHVLMFNLDSEEWHKMQDWPDR